MIQGLFSNQGSPRRCTFLSEILHLVLSINDRFIFNICYQSCVYVLQDIISPQLHDKYSYVIGMDNNFI